MKNAKDSETMSEAFRATSYNCKCPKVDLLNIDEPLSKIKLNTLSLQILLAYCESFAIATRFYKCVFSIDSLSLKTYFNFY